MGEGNVTYRGVETKHKILTNIELVSFYFRWFNII